MNKQKQAISIPQLDVRVITIDLVGDSPLITHAWSEKAKKQIRDKQMKKASKGREAKDPEAEFRAAMYVHEDGWHGMPAIAFKSAAVRAATDAGMNMTDARRAFHVEGTDDKELVCIQAPEPRMREDMVKLRGVADIRYRPEYWPWRVTLLIKYNASVISAEQVINLLRIAGFGVGVGEHRPEKNGQLGLFHVATGDENE